MVCSRIPAFLKRKRSVPLWTSPRNGSPRPPAVDPTSFPSSRNWKPRYQNQCRETQSWYARNIYACNELYTYLYLYSLLIEMFSCVRCLFSRSLSKSHYYPFPTSNYTNYTHTAGWGRGRSKEERRTATRGGGSRQEEGGGGQEEGEGKGPWTSGITINI